VRALTVHPGAAAQLRERQAAVLARARGRCEACAQPLAHGAVPVSPIDGLPTPEQMLALCEACVSPVMHELASIANLAELEARVAALRARR